MIDPRNSFGKRLRPIQTAFLLVAFPFLAVASDRSSKEEPEDTKWKQELAERSQWWNLQPPVKTTPPSVSRAEWSREPVDQFILHRLREEGIDPAAPADGQTLLRRLSFVLTGLPPRPEQVAEFETKYRNDPEAALAALVGELLASPHFGERIARHWMDVVRYTDTYGYEWDITAKGAWEYRDYLIRAFNDDVGFDQMIREQIAGDLLPEPRINKVENVNESVIGPMFYHLGEHRHGNSMQFNGIHQEMIDNKIDAFSKAFLGMTVACARCHDHKLDAISQRDYYALAGMFMTPRWTTRVIDAPGKHDSQIDELKKLREAIRDEMGRIWMAEIQGGALDPSKLMARAAAKSFPLESPGHPIAMLANHASWLEVSDLAAEASNEGTQLNVESDGKTVLVTGDVVPQSDTYTVTFSTPAGPASMIRLEALTHPSLGSSGPGRTVHGNFVLSQIEVEVTPKGSVSSQSIALQSATADYEQPNYPVARALDSSAVGWGVGLGGNVNRTATFRFRDTLALPKGAAWKVTLRFDLGGGHTLGHFRVAPGAMVASSSGVLQKWTELREEWRKTNLVRHNQNQNFTVLADFSEAGFPEGWVTEGDGIEHGYVRNGTPRIALEGDAVIASILPQGYHTHALSPKLPGAVRAPDPATLERKKMRVKITGGEWAGRSAAPQNAFLNEGPIFFDPTKPPQWTPVDSPNTLTNGVTRVLTDFVTASLHPNFPPRTGVARSGSAGLPNDDEGFEKRSWFSLVGIAADDEGKAPVDLLDGFSLLYDAGEPTSSEEVWDGIVSWLSGAVERFANAEATKSDAEIVNWLLNEELLTNAVTGSESLAGMVKRYREIEETIAFARTANSMEERDVDPIDYRLNLRGDVYDEGPEIRRGFLEVFAGKHDVGRSEGSGRLELADYLASRENPVTARVYVNRVWSWIFGTGLVSTPSDFGKLGSRPSHPELLDWLTLQFIEEGWSTKKLVRRLVLSQTFRQSGENDPVADERDPENKLLHHFATRRLEAEAIRDSILAVAGRLDRSLYGPPINPPRAAEDPAKRLFSGPLDGNGRRSVYLEMSIMQPPEFLVGFNLPAMKLPTGRRDVTNVPSQALILLNDPFVLEMAKVWGARLALEDDRTTEDRIHEMFLAALGRPPTDAEQKRWSAAAEDGDWTAVAHSMFNVKEFIYYR